MRFDTISPYNICADRLGITKTSNHWMATIANWKGKPSHVKENPKQITYYIDSKMVNLRLQGISLWNLQGSICLTKRNQCQDTRSYGKTVLVRNIKILPIRIISWHPFPIMFYPNFNRILARMLEKEKISFKLPEGHDNAFEEIGISRNIFMQMSLAVMSLENLQEKFINPALRNMFPDYANSFIYGNTTINQSEICFDIPTNSREEVKEIIFSWGTRNMRIFHYSNLEWEKRNPIFHFKTEDGLRFKMYGKGKLVSHVNFVHRSCDAVATARIHIRQNLYGKERTIQEILRRNTKRCRETIRNPG